MDWNLLHHAKRNRQDYEWYPTTKEIIDAVKARLWSPDLSILDIGAGDGRVLHSLTNNKGKKFAIEKSRPLLSALTADVLVVGTDFSEQTIFDKPVDVVFSNPPYSEFETWSARVIKEAHARKLYLVIPQRWKKSEMIAQALRFRGTTATVILNTSFEDGDRRARAVVDVLEIDIESTDPCKLWFEENFFKPHRFGEGLDKALADLSQSDSIVSELVKLYQQESQLLMSAYSHPTGLRWISFFISNEQIHFKMQSQLAELKRTYWTRFISEVTVLKHYKRHFDDNWNSLFQRIDFTENNALALLEWVIKNSGYQST